MLMTVTQMLHVPTPLGTSPVPVTKDSVEMALSVWVILWLVNLYLILLVFTQIRFKIPMH